jgi:hypothetical protein
MNKNLFKNKLWLMGILLLVALTSAPAWAASITINNYSFEDNILTDNQFTNYATGWTVTKNIPGGGGGAWNLPLRNYGGQAPDGSNVGWVLNASISQELAATVQAHYTYTLEAYVGKKSIVSSVIADYHLQLVAIESGAVLAEATGNATYNTFTLVTTEYIATNQHIGEHLKIVIGDTHNAELDFDKVTLNSTHAPLPSTVLLLGSGLVGVALLRRKWNLKK